VADVCLTRDGKVLLARYKDTSGYDGEGGWFLPDDFLRHMEHPEDAARRIVQDQTGIRPPRLRLSHIESFEGNGFWHLVFHYAGEFAEAVKASPGANVGSIEWFPLDRLPPAEDVGHGGWALETIRVIRAAKA
jgi:ADP-ribose pyrophosphatase YjhB (NUDIX family)